MIDYCEQSHDEDQHEVSHDLSSNEISMTRTQLKDISTQEAVRLIQDGASLFGRMVLLSERQINSLSGDLKVLDLKSDVIESLDTLQQSTLSGDKQFYALPLENPEELRHELSQLQIHVHKLIGVTGTIGSGKSAAMKELEAQGAFVLSADLIARTVVAPGSEGIEAIRKAFGQEYVLPDGSLDRKRLGSLIFSDEKQRDALNAILHPLIRQEYLESLLAVTKSLSQNALIAYEVPLLFESKHSHPELEASVLITASEETCIQRIMKRDNLSREEAAQRIAAQMPVHEKEARATLVISNDSNIDELSASLEFLFDEINSL